MSIVVISIIAWGPQMRFWAVILLAFLLPFPTLAGQEAHINHCRDLISGSEISTLVGKTIKVSGRFSLSGKEGPYINCKEDQIYFMHKGPYNYGLEWFRIDNHTITVTGVLKAYKSEGIYVGTEEQKAPNHLYFDQEAAKIQLERR